MQIEARRTEPSGSVSSWRVVYDSELVSDETLDEVEEFYCMLVALFESGATWLGVKRPEYRISYRPRRTINHET